MIKQVANQRETIKRYLIIGYSTVDECLKGNAKDNYFV